MNMDFYVPVRMISGRDCVKNSAKFFQLGRKCLIVTGHSAAKLSGALADVQEALASQNIESVLFDGIGQNPKLSDCMKAAELGVAEGVDMIVGIGGGSPLDASKCIAVLVANPGMTQETLYAYNWENKPLPVICVGTTAGTGSEVTKVSVITTLEGRKKSLNHVDIYPKVSFGDYSYTMSLSDTFTRSTAVDAFMHCMESYFNRLSNEICRGFAVRGIRLLLEMFVKMKSGAKLGEAEREQLYNASIYGGLAITVTGTAMPHAVGYILSEDHGVPHGVACGLFLRDFWEETKAAEPECCEQFLKEIGCGEEFLDLVEETMPVFEVTMDEAELQAAASRWESNGSINKSYGQYTAGQITEILRRKFATAG